MGWRKRRRACRASRYLRAFLLALAYTGWVHRQRWQCRRLSVFDDCMCRVISVHRACFGRTVTSCQDAINVIPTLTSGPQTISFNGLNSYPVWCEFPSGTTDGWTLLMKIDGQQTTFTYDSSLWTSQNTWNTGNSCCLSSFALSHHFMQAFNSGSMSACGFLLSANFLISSLLAAYGTSGLDYNQFKSPLFSSFPFTVRAHLKKKYSF